MAAVGMMAATLFTLSVVWHRELTHYFCLTGEGEAGYSFMKDHRCHDETLADRTIKQGSPNGQKDPGKYDAGM